MSHKQGSGFASHVGLFYSSLTLTSSQAFQTLNSRLLFPPLNFKAQKSPINVKFQPKRHKTKSSFQASCANLFKSFSLKIGQKWGKMCKMGIICESPGVHCSVTFVAQWADWRWQTRQSHQGRSHFDVQKLNEIGFNGLNWQNLGHFC